MAKPIYSALIILVAAFSAYAQKGGVQLEVGTSLPPERVPSAPKSLTVGCCFHPYIEEEVDGIKYLIAYRAASREVSYISTSDKKLKTADGYRVGQKIRVSRNDLISAGGAGFALYAPPTSEGWRPIVGYDLSLPNRKGKLESQNPFEGVEQSKRIEVRILGFGKW